ncbi:MAG TPA: hypothetical protein VKB56_09065 [Terriglobales bacterium]|nr:hypothetical protein [Terriglobales bacterium]
MSAAHIASDVNQLLAPTVEAVVLCVLIARGLWREFPSFAAYAALHVVKLPALFFLNRNHHYYKVYFVTYWATEALSAVLTYAVIYELYQHVFRRYHGLEKVGRIAMNCIAAGCILIGVVAAGSATVSNYASLVREIFAIRQTVDILRLGLVVFLLVFASFFRLRWPSYLFGIAVGLAFYGCCELAGQAIQLHFGPSANLTYSLLIGGAYTCTVFIWMVYLLRYSTVPEQSYELPANDLATWNNALAGMLNR